MAERSSQRHAKSMATLRIQEQMWQEEAAPRRVVRGEEATPTRAATQPVDRHDDRTRQPSEQPISERHAMESSGGSEANRTGHTHPTSKPGRNSVVSSGGMLAAGMEVAIPGHCFEGPEPYLNEAYYGYIERLTLKTVHVRFHSYIAADGSRRRAGDSMWWPRTRFESEWIYEAPLGASDDEAALEDDPTESNIEGYELGEEPDEAADIHLDHMVEEVVNSASEATGYWPDNEKGDSVPMPARLYERTKLNSEKVQPSPGMGMKDFLYTVLGAETTVDKWLAYSNTNMELYFKALRIIARENGTVFKRELYGRQCEKIKKREMEGMLAIFLIKGAMGVRSLEDAWKLNPNKRNAGIASIMSHRRFMQIWKFFRVNDPCTSQSRMTREDEPYDEYVFDAKHSTYHRVRIEYDPLYWVRPFMDALQSKMKEQYIVGGLACVDEFLYGSYHHVSWHRCIKGKPNPHGILIFLICSTITNKDNPDFQQQLHIAHNFRIYVGGEEWQCQKGPRGGKGRPAPEWRGLGEAGCFFISMAEELVRCGSMRSGSTVAGDRAFSSKVLIDRLKRGIQFEDATTGQPAMAYLNWIGTCRADRIPRLPQMQIPEAATRGTVVFRMARDGRQGIGWWLDTKWVLLVTLGLPWLEAEVKRRVKQKQIVYGPLQAGEDQDQDRWRMTVDTALPYKLYNEEKSAVDCYNRDAHTSFRAGYKCFRVWKHVYFWLFNAWVYQAYGMYVVFQSQVKDAAGENAYKPLGRTPQKEFRYDKQSTSVNSNCGRSLLFKSSGILIQFLY